MAFIRAKSKAGKKYFELVENRRVGGEVQQRVVKYLGSLEDAKAYSASNGIRMPSSFRDFDQKPGKAGRALLALSDGSFFAGNAFGAEVERVGELVFTTSMTGYQESLTDPSYRGQILAFAYPLQGNYGVNREDVESGTVHVSGVVAGEACAGNGYSHKDAFSDLSDYLASAGVPGISGIDTRAIVLKVRERGVMPAAICPLDSDANDDAARELALQLNQRMASFDYGAINFLPEVSTPARKVFSQQSPKKSVALVDCGVKMNIVRELARRKIEVVLLPFNSTTKQILSEEPDGVVFSNGPGDPALAKAAVEAALALSRKLPIFGICLGNQILGRAFGAKTYKLKFGHRGTNHAVKNVENGKVFITSHNHGYSVDARTLPREVAPLFEDCNDKSNEGLRHKELPVFSCQFHPEGSAGPQDSNYLFDDFVKLL